MIILNKHIADAGICSRRKAAELVKTGQVVVNGAVVYDPSYRVKPEDMVKINKKVVRHQEKVYILLNKPKNCLTTVSDERGRPTVMDLLGGAPRVRLYPVGRLDRATTGLLVMTNDGALAQKLSHPSYEIKKTYQVTLRYPLRESDLEKIREGVVLEDGKAVVDQASFVPGMQNTVVNVEIHSGKNRIVRRIFEHFDCDIKKLDRIGYAGLTKKMLPCSRWRFLSEREVSMLLRYGTIR